MHFPTAVIALLATTAIAVPTWGKDHDDKKWGKDKDNRWGKVDSVFSFDKTYIVNADPRQVRNGTIAVPGQRGAKGLFKYGINVAENTICYNITLSGVTGEYKSPALTATHIHQAAKGTSGLPRLAFPNPKGPDHRRVSYGCVTGPFKTGVKDPATGLDSGDGFHVKQIVLNPQGFFTDSHTVEFSLGAVRGQLGY